MVSCKDFSIASYVKGDALASVGNAELYPEDVAALFTPGMNPEDSLKLLNSYIDLWIKKQLKIQLAEAQLSDNETDIDKMVEDYRNSLLIYEYEKQYVGQHMDTVITTDEIGRYYNDNEDEFRLGASLMKAVVVKIPVSFRQENKLRDLARSGNTDKLQDMIDICIKNDLEYKEFSSWTDFATVISSMPRLSDKDYQRVQTDLSFYEVTEGGYRYFLVVTGLLKEGAPMPLNMAAGTIKTMIINKRKQELLRVMEDSIYNAALGNGEITINNK